MKSIAAGIVLALCSAAGSAESTTQLPMGEILVTSDAPQLLVAGAESYPAIAQRLGQQGKVELKLAIGVDGLTRDVEIVSSSGHRALDLAAVRQAEKFRYRPARANGEPVPSFAIVPVSFVLEDPNAERMPTEFVATR